MRHFNTKRYNAKQSAGFTLVELLVVIAIIGTLVGLLLPAVQNARESARANTCKNNLRQLALALTTRESSLGDFPGYINKTGIPGDLDTHQIRASWAVMTFPYLEQVPLWELWNKQGNGGIPKAPVTQAFPSIEILVCPSDPPESIGEPLLSYVGNTGFVQNDSSSSGGPENLANGVFFDRTRTPVGTSTEGAAGPDDNRDTANERVKRMTIAYISAKGDGTTRTLMLTENINATHWGYYGAQVPDEKYHFGFCWEQPKTVTTAVQATLDPNDLKLETDARYRRVNGIRESLDHDVIASGMTKNYGFPSSNHPGGVQAAFVAGQVQLIAEQIDPFVYGQIMTSNHKRSDLQNFGGTYEKTLAQPNDDAF